MGQKVNPIGLRLGINKTWDSRWYAGADYKDKLLQDIKIREYVRKTYPQAAIAKVIIERANKKAVVSIHTARPGVMIGKKGSDIEKLKSKITQMAGTDVSINIVEVRKPELNAQLIADTIAQQLERRVSFRRAMKKSMQMAFRVGALGLRVNCSGRLAGAEIARMEWYREGRVPLQTLRSEIDYGVGTAFTTYGAIGVKVWVYTGESSTIEQSEKGTK